MQARVHIDLSRGYATKRTTKMGIESKSILFAEMVKITGNVLYVAGLKEG